VTPDEKLLTPDEVAERLALSPFTVANMLRAGTLPGMKVGTLWRIRAADLDAYIVAGSEAAAKRREARAAAAKRKAAGLPPKPNAATKANATRGQAGRSDAARKAAATRKAKAAPAPAADPPTEADEGGTP